ncbi:MAG: tRNA (N(6)-L-threonylcarbamoyladenosine(37)-C(2))-methylthiotransferase MtaB [Candidatus Riflebacteria bacterium]|jgi:threonylcarbamoyladenosine tRNA methylthiotransferase MtaB|nr:tRNA (N(6)-L-threonylcarbamoyladenosine(37)-C(2))-methylthiotransferase MtaB [Candidatus Riflebacteria bacterium]
MTTFLLKSLGCKVSQYDGERLAEKLRQHGLQPVDDAPDVFILNGCSVTGRASQKVRQTLRAARRNWPTVKLVLAGCEARLVTQRHQELPDIDWLLKDGETASVEAMLAALALDVTPVSCEKTLSGPISAKTRAFLKIQDGCNQFCAYCIVAHLRGEEWSRPVEDAVAEARNLVAEGHREIVLTGIHLGHYRPSLLHLLWQLDLVDGLERIRLSSIEPVEVTDDLIDWVATSPKACRHFHLPLQSGCDKTLKAMRRPYLTADFRAIVDKIRRRMPLAAITTDLIVGFPGETEADFAETLSFLEEIRFSRLHIFRFSPRDGTPAATMPDQVDNVTRAERAGRVEQVWQKCSSDFYRSFVGQPLEVLWETLENGQLCGFSREYVPCRLARADESLLNHLSPVKGLELVSEHLSVILDN